MVTQVKKWVAQGLPEEATQYVGWYVEIDGQRLSPNWLFHLITGASYEEFITTQAREKLARIGFVAMPIRDGDRVRRPIVRKEPGRPTANQPYYQILDKRVTDIKNVLDGSVATPSDEVLCDWVHFCYKFGMFKEGETLFTLVTSEQVNPWYYERTKKFARLCSMRAAVKD